MKIWFCSKLHVKKKKKIKNFRPIDPFFINFDIFFSCFYISSEFTGSTFLHFFDSSKSHLELSIESIVKNWFWNRYLGPVVLENRKSQINFCLIYWFFINFDQLFRILHSVFAESIFFPHFFDFYKDYLELSIKLIIKNRSWNQFFGPDLSQKSNHNYISLKFVNFTSFKILQVQNIDMHKSWFWNSMIGGSDGKIPRLFFSQTITH